MARIETLILKNLFFNEDYMRKVLPFVKEEYFLGTGDSVGRTEKTVFKTIKDFVAKYNCLPTLEAVEIHCGESSKLDEEDNKAVRSYLSEINTIKNEEQVPDWMLEQTEKFCQERAMHLALSEAIEIDAGTVKGKDKGMIPKILQDALAVSFDTNIGHDYLEDWEYRFDFYHTKEKRVKFDLDMFNKITRGGLPIKTLNVILAGTNVGKSLILCHTAASAMMMGYNVLYITLEMAEEKIAMRIDANLLDVAVNDLEVLPRDIYEKKVERIKSKALGKLVIKEYPTASAHTGHFRYLLNELNLKKNFKPDLVIVDYINICTSSRIKNNGSANSYTIIKSIAEELRGLAVEFCVPVLTATQTNREGFDNSDVDLTNTAESFGLPATADFIIAAISNEELQRMNQFLMKQLKSRYNDMAQNRKFLIGVDRAKMRLYDVEQAAQDDIQPDANDDDPPPFDVRQKRKDMKDKFASFKFGGE